MNIKKDTLYLAVNNEGEIFQTKNGKCLFKSLGYFKNSVISGAFEDNYLKEYRIYPLRISLSLFAKDVNLYDLKCQIESIRELEEEKRRIEDKIRDLRTV